MGERYNSVSAVTRPDRPPSAPARRVLKLIDHLQSALGKAYTIERELGGGGMSRVFVAREATLDRDVVIKLIPPALAAGVNEERFRRETLMTAMLQHTNIVPVLACGEADGLLYYTMPYIDGPSLRKRLDDDGALPVTEAVTVLRDVLRALSYAHQRGIVHRDIKPDNILLSHGGAVVTDFGIAKALTDAKHGVGALTDPEMLVGTPSYFAPEQATASAPIDHRADLYALGCVAYEMLTGEHVFPGRPPNAQMVAHVNEPPPALSAKRPDAGEVLDTFVARCLSKDPARRPESADIAIRMLQRASAGITSPVVQPPPRRRIVAWSLAGVAVIGVVAAYLALPKQLLASLTTLARRRPMVTHVNRVVVTPFEDHTGDQKLAALGPMVADYIGEGLSRIGSLEVVDARTAYIAGEVVRRVPRLLRAFDESRAIAEETGAKVVVAGSVYRMKDTVSVEARIVDGRTGRVMQALPAVFMSATAPKSAIEQLIGRITTTLQIASDTGVSIMPGVYSTPPTLEAYDEMRQGMEWYFKRDEPMTTLHLKRSIRLDSTYVTPVVMLAFVYLQWAEPRLADSVAAVAGRIASRASGAERAMLRYVQATLAGEPAVAVQASQQFMELQPGSMEAPLLAANAALSTRQPRLALDALGRTDPDHGLNLAGGYYWQFKSDAMRQLGNWRESIALAREGLRRFPDDYDTYFSLALPLSATGRVDELQPLLRRVRPDRAGWLVGEAIAPVLIRFGHEREARKLVDEWLRRTEHDSTGTRGAAEHRGFLYLEGERWPELERLTSRWLTLALLDEGSLTMAALRASALIHLNRAPEARAIDSAIAAVHPRFMRARYVYARGRIAAQLGQSEAAARLLDEALRAGFAMQYYSTGLWYDPLLLPLAGYEPFEELIRSGA